MEAFQIVVLGCTGGPRENDLTGYLLSPLEPQEWIALDAGSLLGGIDCALKKNNLSHVSFIDPILTPAGEMLIKHLRGFLISHAHLDHILGMILNSQSDVPKNILAIDPTIDNLRDHIFNGRIWPNYGNEGSPPVIHLYNYIRLPLEERQEIPQTSMHVEAFLLSHPDSYPSTAFLIEHQNQYFLYIGDTSSDAMEPEKRLTHIWERIAPLIKDQSLRGIMLECSYAQAQSNQVVYGHLDSQLMIQELRRLQEIAQTSVKGLKVVVTHRKETLHKGQNTKEIIRDELLKLNDLGIHFIFPEQGDRYLF